MQVRYSPVRRETMARTNVAAACIGALLSVPALPGCAGMTGGTLFFLVKACVRLGAVVVSLEP